MVTVRRKGPRVFAFLLAASIVLAYALRSSGTYDLLSRQEDGLVIWWTLAIGFALRLLPRRAPSGMAWVVIGALLLYAAWSGISIIWSESPERSTAELARALDYVGLMVLLASVLDRTTWRSAALGWMLGAMVVSGLALASRLAPSAFPVSNAGIVFGVSRLSYPFGYWNAVGAWAAVSVALGLAWSANDRRPWPRMLSLAGVPVAATAAYLTYSRGAAAGLVVAAVAVAALSRNRWTALIHIVVGGLGGLGTIATVRAEPQIAHGTGTAGARTVLLALLAAAGAGALTALLTRAAHVDRWRLPRRLALPAGAAALVVIAVAGAVAGPGLASRAWNDFRHPQVVQNADPALHFSSLSGSRYQLWKVALAAFDRYPVHGTGAGTFQFWWNRHATQAEFVQNAHSLWLETMAELGAPGLLTIVGFSISALALGIRARRRGRRGSSVAGCVAATAGLLVFLVQASADWMWQSTALTVLALGGIAIASVRLSSRRPRCAWPARVALVLLCVVAGAIQAPGLLSSAEIGASQAAVRADTGARALAWANLAITAEPWAASPYLQRGLVLEALGRFRSADADLDRAIAHEPTNFELWVIDSRIETEEGHRLAAVRSYARALQLRPFALVLNR